MNRNNASAIPEDVGVFRPKDAERWGVSRTALQRLLEAGKIERVGRGLYVRVGANFTQHHTLAEAARRVPGGIVCLLSALNYHRMTTQSPHEVWIAIPEKARKPNADWPPLRILRFSGEALTFGAEVHLIEGVEVTVTSRAKTVADCFKYRNKLGVDLAVEALRDYLCRRGRSMDAPRGGSGLPRGTGDATLPRSTRMTTNTAHSVKDRLLKLSKERREEFNFVLVRYGLERLLYRLSCSSHADEFILKGAMLFTVWAEHPHRATKDLTSMAAGIRAWSD
ncbi:MAG: type IV toxin-antitoxin system AbiEi family antitoxin domain-containing protein [Polyangiaceae bacterium]